MRHLSAGNSKKAAFGGRRGFILCAASVYLADQLSKAGILSAMAPYDSIPVIPGFLHMTFIYNTGASFGMFQNRAGFFMAMSGLLSVAICWAAIFRPGYRSQVRMLLGLICGGAFGNLTDRILRGGAVVDFIDFRGIWPYIFNIADMAVVGGGMLLALSILLEDRKAQGGGEGYKPKH